MAEYTNFEVEYVLDDGDISGSATLTTQNSFPECVPQMLKVGSSLSEYVSTEHNATILDGNRTLIGGMFSAIGFISNTRSGEDGTFTNIPTIKCKFNTLHTVPTLSFKFLSDVPTKVRFVWGVGTSNSGSITTPLVKSGEYYNAYLSAMNINFLNIEFLEALPDRYVVVSKINFGGSFVWDETFVKSATLVKGFNRLSDQLSIDTLNFELVDKDGTLDLSSNSGILSMFVREQPIYPKEYVDDKVVDLGVFYLDTFTSATTGVATISATSILGLLDHVPFYEGVVVTNGLAGHTISSILDKAGVKDYEIDSVTYMQRITGTIKPKSCKEALSDVLFACNSVIDTSNPSKVVIKKFSEGRISSIPRHTKVSTALTQSPTATSVKLTYTKYTISSEEEELYKETLPRGIHTIELSKCSAYQTISGATFTQTPAYGTCVFTINVPSEGEVIIMGNGFDESNVTITKSRPLKQGELENVIEYSTTLCDNLSAKTLLDKLFNWHQRALLIDIQHYAEDVVMDGSRSIQNPKESLLDFVGLFTERSLDLTEGFLDSAKLIGYYDVSSLEYFASSGDVGELYASDSIIL